MPYQPPPPKPDDGPRREGGKTGGGKGKRPPRHPGRRPSTTGAATGSGRPEQQETSARTARAAADGRPPRGERGRGGRPAPQRAAGGGRGRRESTPEEREARKAAREARVARRREVTQTLTISYPAELPVSARRDDIAAAIRDHQVVVVAGETGSGKTTQIPKICLELGRGVAGQIGHTQPRRIAARSVAERLADELGVQLGEAVGYQVRFTDTSSRDTLVKVMTDGILLSELQRDRDLRRYDTIVIDEAHERSLNIDFILGYLAQLLPRRPDLKVVITSATIDPQRFAAHFAAVDGTPAPIVEVSGRTYPVELRYRPLVRSEPNPRRRDDPKAPLHVDVEIDQVTGICDAVEELWTEAGSAQRARDGGGEDILVFCSGEREIRDAVDALSSLNLPQTQIVPLYGRLSADEQHRVFAPHAGRRVVVATNVAETSLTVPGIRYVVDTGTARISRYSQRTKVQRLPIEPISQASANQRSGRCGRVADGIAIRLYAQDDFEGRPEFTDPEILRTNLASVILQMTSLGLGDIARFPFVDAPDSRMIADGLRLLEELGAVDPDEKDPRRRLTDVGRSLARIPVDPRLARMLLAAHAEGALREVLVVVAALSIQDVRERPTEKQAQADQQHARFKDKDSDVVTLLNLWDYLRGEQKDRSGSAFRRMCKEEYLHYLRIREWQDLVGQLRAACRELDLSLNTHPASPDAVHRSLLAGLLSHVGLYDRDRRDYLGARGARFALQPGSVLFRRNPDWVMAAELVETTRLWARTNAAIDPDWGEAAAGHLLKRTYAEPRWSRSRAAVVADERVTLYGVPLVVGRTVAYGKVDPEVSRDLFIRHALVEGDWDTPHRFFHDNRKLVERLSELETRARRRDLLVEDEDLVEFYDRRIPADVVSGAHFDAWWKSARRQSPDLLTFTEDVLVSDVAARVADVYTTSTPGAQDVPGPPGAAASGALGAALGEAIGAAYPRVWHQGELALRLTYQFEPGTDADGVTCHVPVEVLNQVSPVGFDWLVPGMREELATALVKSLPKASRKHVVPAPDRAREALAQADPTALDAGVPLTDELARGLFLATGHRIAPGEWDSSRLPDHLRMTFRIEDARRRPLGEGKDLSDLQDRLAPKVRTTMRKAAGDLERRGLTSWDFGELPASFEARRGQQTLQGYPALVDEGDSVAIHVLASAAEQAHATRLGLRRLLLLNLTAPWKRILALLTNEQRLALGHNPHGSMPALLDDVLACAVDAIAADRPGGTVRTAAQFGDALAAVRQQVVPRVIEIVELVHPVLERALAVRLALDGMRSPAAADLKADLSAQLDALVFPGFVAATGLPQLRHLPRYLQAMLVRIDKGPTDLPRDAQRTETIRVVEDERAKLVEALPTTERGADDVLALRWMVEELRVSLFAPALRTPYPVSEKRIYKAMDAVEDAHAG